MEVVIAVGVLAVAIPVIMGMMVTGTRSSRVATDETQAALIARSVMQEVRSARDGRGLLVDGTLPWPEFPAGGERLVFSAGAGGELLERLGDGEYASGLRDREVRYLVSATGTRHRLEAMPDETVLSKVVVSVETPPGAKPEDRKKHEFVQLVHRDD
jgi:hypothetical protein